MNYIDVKKLYTQVIALYCRVSTDSQDIQKQISLAELYLSQRNISINTVKRFIDDSVSANKLMVKERPELKKLLTDIKTGKVNILLVQARDRLARNFYEYIEIVKIFHQYQVEVIFTEAGQPPFSEALSIEALYGIFPQVNGKTIASRTNQIQKRYPNSILGFNVIGKNRHKKYIPNYPKADDLKSFFYEIIDSQTTEDVIQIFIKFKQLFSNDHQKALNCLQNPFYAGHFKFENEYLPLNYVEPIISLKDFLKIQSVLKNHEQILQNAIKKSTNTGIHIPICHICKQSMAFRKTSLGKCGYYVCMKKHKRIQIDVSHFNQLIDNHLMDITKRIQVQAIKKDVFSHLLQMEKNYKQEIGHLQNKFNAVQRNMVNLVGSNKTSIIKSLVEQSNLIKEEMIYLDMLLEKINYSRKEINAFTDIVKQRISEELEQYQIEYLSKLLFSKIEVSTDALIYHTNFTNYIEGKVLNEY